MKKPAESNVVRISKANYQQLGSMKQAYAKRNKLARTTYNAFLSEVLTVAKAMFEGTEFYIVGSTVYEDVAEARGEAIRQAVRAKQVPVPPKVCVFIGLDDGLERHSK